MKESVTSAEMIAYLEHRIKTFRIGWTSQPASYKQADRASVGGVIYMLLTLGVINMDQYDKYYQQIEG